MLHRAQNHVSKTNIKSVKPTLNQYFVTLLVDQDDYDKEEAGDADSSKLMPPPSWIPPPHTTTSGHSSSSVSVSSPSGDSTPPSAVNNVQGIKSEESKTSTSPIKTPLAAMLPPELAKRDVKDLFPEFRPGKVQ